MQDEDNYLSDITRLAVAQKFVYFLLFCRRYFEAKQQDKSSLTQSEIDAAPGNHHSASPNNTGPASKSDAQPSAALAGLSARVTALEATAHLAPAATLVQTTTLGSLQQRVSILEAAAPTLTLTDNTNTALAALTSTT